MDLSKASNSCFLLLVCLCTILGREVLNFKTKQNDVFLNSRDHNTSYGIISYLDDALSRRKIKTFIDGVHPKPEDLPPLMKEIEASRVAVVVFSEDYASTSESLDVLLRITECRGILGLKVLPIFHSIDPSDVSNQNGSFQAAFDRHEEDYKDKLYVVRRWRAALMEVSSLAGFDSRIFRREPDLVKQAVDNVAELLKASLSEEEAAAGRGRALFCVFFPVVILLYHKNYWLPLFGRGFTSSVCVTATILFFVFLGVWIRDQWVYLGTFGFYHVVLSFILRSPRSASERSVVSLFLLVLIGTLWRRHCGVGEADVYNKADVYSKTDAFLKIVCAPRSVGEGVGEVDSVNMMDREADSVSVYMVETFLNIFWRSKSR